MFERVYDVPYRDNAGVENGLAIHRLGSSQVHSMLCTPFVFVFTVFESLEPVQFEKKTKKKKDEKTFTLIAALSPSCTTMCTFVSSGWNFLTLARKYCKISTARLPPDTGSSSIHAFWRVHLDVIICIVMLCAYESVLNEMQLTSSECLWNLKRNQSLRWSLVHRQSHWRPCISRLRTHSAKYRDCTTFSTSTRYVCPSTHEN